MSLYRLCALAVYLFDWSLWVVFDPECGMKSVIDDIQNFQTTTCRWKDVRYTNNVGQCSYCITEDRCRAPCQVVTVEYRTNGGRLQTSTIVANPHFDGNLTISLVSTANITTMLKNCRTYHFENATKLTVSVLFYLNSSLSAQFKSLYLNMISTK